jgi:hypothetical protein
MLWVKNVFSYISDVKYAKRLLRGWLINIQETNDAYYC